MVNFDHQRLVTNGNDGITALHLQWEYLPLPNILIGAYSAYFNNWFFLLLLLWAWGSREVEDGLLSELHLALDDEVETWYRLVLAVDEIFVGVLVEGGGYEHLKDFGLHLFDGLFFVVF
jgi:hypothetical protein